MIKNQWFYVFLKCSLLYVLTKTLKLFAILYKMWWSISYIDNMYVIIVIIIIIIIINTIVNILQFTRKEIGGKVFPRLLASKTG